MLQRLLFLLFFLSSGLDVYAQSCISHRALVNGGVENSLEGIRLARAYGVDGIEIDVQFTKDYVPILIHDKNLKRVARSKEASKTCPLDEKISKLKWEEIDKNCELFNGEPVVTLSKALIELIDYEGFIFIDVKKSPPGSFINIIKGWGMDQKENVRFLSFKKRALKKIERYLPQVKSILLSRYIPRGFGNDGAAHNRRLRFFQPLFRFFGKETGLWTLNSRADMLMAIDKEVDYIITDYPERCLELNRR